MAKVLINDYPLMLLPKVLRKAWCSFRATESAQGEARHLHRLLHPLRVPQQRGLSYPAATGGATERRSEPGIHFLGHCRGLRLERHWLP